jgi:hypothetical protein
MSLQVGIEARAADGIDFADAAALVQRERYQMFHLDYDHEKLEKIKKFEDDIFEGPFAFWLGLYYFLRSSGEGANSISAGEVVHGLSFYTRYFQDNKWRASLPYLKMLDIIRFDGDALDAVFTLDVRP